MSERNGSTEGHGDESNGSATRGIRDRLGSIDRRQYLKLGAATAVGAAAFSGQSSAQSRGGVSFDRVVDAVDDLGMDPNGNQPIDSQLASAFGDGTLIEFPAGDYLVRDYHQFDSVSNCGIVGKTGDRSDVQFVFPSGYDGRFLNVRFGQNWLFGDFTVQQDDDWQTGVELAFGPNRNATIRNVEIDGYNPRNLSRGLAMVVYDADGEATVDGYVRTGRSAVGDYPSGTQAMLVPREHEGTLTIRNARIENAGENGIYASRGAGDVHIEGGYFANNDIASVRIAGDGSYVKGATFVVDHDSTNNRGGYFNSRALWIESGFRSYTGGLVEDCDFILESAENSGGLLRVGSTAGDVTVRNCRFRNDTKYPTMYAESPSNVSGSGPITVQNCSFSGDGTAPRQDFGAVGLEGRDGSTVSDCCISMDGPRAGVVVMNASGCTVRRSTIDVGGQTVASRGSSVATSSISSSGSCPLPSDGGSGAGGSTGSGGSGGSSDDSSSDDSSGEESTEEDDSSDEESTEESTEQSTEESDSSDEETSTEESTEESTEQSSEGSSEESDSSDGDAGTASASSDDGGSRNGSSGGERTLTLSGSSVSPYEFTVSGDVEFDPAFGTEDRIDGSTVRGVLAGGTDMYRFSGEITSFSIGGDATLRLDGETVSASALGGGSGSSGSSGEENTETTETETETEQSTETTDAQSTETETETTETETETTETETETSSDDGSSDDASDESSGSDSDGGSSSGDAATGGSSGTDDLANIIILKGDGAAPYHLEVSGDIAYLPGYGREDSVGSNDADGTLYGGADAYMFSGLVTAFEYENDPSVRVNGASVAPGDVVGSGYDGAGDGQSGSKVLSLVGDASRYSFAVDGSVERAPDFGGDDIIDGQVVRGALNGGRDDYRIDGDLLWFEVDGDCEARVDGEAVDPSNLPNEA